jgi:maltoporin
MGADKQLDARKDSKTMRLVEELLAQFGKDLATNFVVLYQNADFGGLENVAGDKIPNKTELTLGVRPVYSFTDTTALAFEVGTTKVDNAIYDGKDYKASQLNKLTIAPEVTAGKGYWARPTLRLFATYASWNDDSKGAIGGDVYKGDTNGFSTGAQLEAWW